MVSETSAHVGRVAARLTISAVVATLAIIAGAAEVLRLRRDYSCQHKQWLAGFIGSHLRNFLPCSAVATGTRRRWHGSRNRVWVQVSLCDTARWRSLPGAGKRRAIVSGPYRDRRWRARSTSTYASSAVAFMYLSILAEYEVHRNLGIYLDCFAVQNVRAVTPLADGLKRRWDQHRVA